MKQKHHQRPAPPSAVSSTVLSGFLVFGLSVMIALLLPKYTALTPLSGWLATINAMGLLVCGFDKRQAVNKRFRVPGKVIVAVALTGGALGVLLGLLAFRHKIKTGHFFIQIAAILLVQALAVYFAIYFKVVSMTQVVEWLMRR
ncbi:predicted membrane protein [Candidatus Moduliflexus flocculans]|uniref:Predicted membrane protein n=1 Tax=Candidatus Moduliflexus flocculans TaxID=1499966 RepID=A0A081BLD2_9BACT|nr:predicted membrane protein [Candidatus Moduliflexus flocculans]